MTLKKYLILPKTKNIGLNLIYRSRICSLNDPDIQRELAAIELEFAATSMDGLKG
jgi:hypothetical protein